LFQRYYPNITFVGRGVTVNNIVGMFELGWFFDKNKEPVNPVTVPLQQTANNILFIDPKEELIPKIDFIPIRRPIAEKYVCISTKSTAQLKLWYYWEEVIAHLLAKGYKVVEISKDETDFAGTEKMPDKSLQTTMNYIYHAEYFLGLSSGLSWLSWALGKKVFMIANFSNKEHEFQTNIVRITNPAVCNGCWNNPIFKFNRGDFFWCPEHEDTERQFECHKSITAAMVIDLLDS
jgi:autotransporter strand-loop-strand O-heptosyltransferase